MMILPLHFLYFHSPSFLITSQYSYDSPTPKKTLSPIKKTMNPFQHLSAPCKASFLGWHKGLFNLLRFFLPYAWERNIFHMPIGRLETSTVFLFNNCSEYWNAIWTVCVQDKKKKRQCYGINQGSLIKQYTWRFLFWVNAAVLNTSFERA